MQALWKVIVPEIRPGMISGFMLALTPVSYTHLDVYKRQELVRASSLYTVHTPVPAGHDYFDEGLDVYKRQMQCWTLNIISFLHNMSSSPKET